MSVSNGQLVNATVTNAAYLSRLTDSDTIAIIGLKNSNISSGSNINNAQQAINESMNTIGMTGEGDSTRKDYSSQTVITNGDSHKIALGKIDALFDNTSGHEHTGLQGEGPKISANNLANINLFKKAYQEFTLNAVSGSSININTQMTGKSSNGSSSSVGVITNFSENKCNLIQQTTNEYIEDSLGNKVYGRITYSSSNWTLSFYKNISGVETSHTLSSENIKVLYEEVFNLESVPTIEINPLNYTTNNITNDTLDASDTQRGLVNTTTQTFSGNKTFNGSIHVLDSTDSSSKDTGSIISEGGLGVEKSAFIGGNLVVVGDFTVNGTSTTLNTSVLDVEDQNITINKNGTDATAVDAGLTVERTSTFGKVLFDSTLTSFWKVGILGSTYEVIVAGLNQIIAGIKTFSNSTESTSPTIGGTLFQGGIGVLKNIFAGGKFNSGSFNGITGYALTSNSAKDIVESSATTTELNYLSGVTSSIQSQLNTKALESNVLHITGTETITGDKTASGYFKFNAKLNLNEYTDSSTSGTSATITPATTVYRFTNTSLLSLATIASPSSGQFLILINDTGVSISILNETGATASERILTGTAAALTMSNGSSIELVYSAGQSRWRVVGGSGGGGGASSLTVTGSQSLSSGTTSQAVTFAVAQGSTNYVVSPQIVNTVDSTPIYQSAVVTNKSTTGFTIKWNSALDTSNYSLDYAIIGGGGQMGEQALTSGTTSQVINIPLAFATTSYVSIVSIVNTVDTNPIFQPVVVSNKTTTTFTVKWNSALDSNNYKLSFYLF